MIPRPRLPRVGRSSLILILTVAALAFPLGALASHQFSDVPDSHDFHNDIDAIADAGVTTGCTATTYCPADFVTRGQMAAFMNRLGALSGQTPSVNASTARSTDGWSIGCPANSALSGGLCFDTSTRGSDDVFDAAEACANLGGGLFGSGQIWKLAPALELRAAEINGDITISTAEWSSTFYYDDANDAQAASVDGNGAVEDHNTLDVLPYRCAAIPLSQDGIIFIPLDQPQDGSDPGPQSESLGTVNEDGSSD